MFRRYVVAAVVMNLCCAGLAWGQTDEDSKSASFVWSSKTNAPINLSDLAAQLSGDDVVVLGEKHDNDSGHEFQLAIIKQLVDSGAQVAISMEQFERDVQGAVNDYLAGRIVEEEFLAAARPWKNYTKHYRAIIEFAKANRLPVLASNVPSRIAGQMAKGGKVNSTDQVFMPRNTTAPENAYWENFITAMEGHVGNDGLDQLKSYFQSQCLKDDSMAEAITDYLATHRHDRKVVVHLCGHMHSDHGLGTVSRILNRQPLARISVITMELLPDSGEPDPGSVADRAHFVFWATPNQSKSSGD